MKRKNARAHLFLLFTLFFLSFLFMADTSGATFFDDLNAGVQITIDDTIHNSTASPGSSNTEDDETEMKASGGNTITDQKWDLEAMFWNMSNKQLTIIGGFDFDNGVDASSVNYSIGDLFVGHFDGFYDPSNQDYGKKYVADYAVELNRDINGNLLNSTEANPQNPAAGTIYRNDGAMTTNPVSYVVPYSNPWTYDNQGSLIGNVNYTIGEVADAPFSDNWGTTGTHYFLQISGLEELADIINGGTILHITMQCGNDAMRAAAVPEPTTILLSGIGLLGMGIFLRRRKADGKSKKTLRNQ